MAYRIITDTCCDLPQQMYKDLKLTVVPLTLTFRGKELSAFPENVLKEVYQGMRDGESGSTAAVNPAVWHDAIEPVLQAGEDVLVMAFSSGLSTTYNSAVIAAQELAEEYPQRKVLVVDTLCASMGQGLLVYYACRKRDEGLDIEELYAWCQEQKMHLCHWFTVENLVYLKRGGRVSAATALVGTMLNIKPVLHVDNAGHLISVAKARGRKASLEMMLNKAKEMGIPGANDVMFLSHGDCREEAEAFAERLKKECGVKDVIISYVGAVIGAHSGPGTMALFFLGTER